MKRKAFIPRKVRDYMELIAGCAGKAAERKWTRFRHQTQKKTLVLPRYVRDGRGMRAMTEDDIPRREKLTRVSDREVLIRLAWRLRRQIRATRETA